MTYNRYTNGKIYQITNNLNDMIYIGSTCLPLRKRWYNHKNEMNYGKGSTRRLFQMAAQIGWDEMRIVLVESYSCDSSDELRRREEYHLQQVPAERRLNMMHAYQTPAEHVEQKRQHAARYQAANKEKIREYMRAYQQTEFARKQKAKLEQGYRVKRKEQYEYRKTWGFRNSCCLLNIDPALFT